MCKTEIKINSSCKLYTIHTKQYKLSLSKERNYVQACQIWLQIFGRKSSKILKSRLNIVDGKTGRLMKLMGKGQHSPTKWFKKDRFSHCINHPIAADRQRYIFTLLFLQNILLQKNLDRFDPKIFFLRELYNYPTNYCIVKSCYWSINE